MKDKRGTNKLSSEWFTTVTGTNTVAKGILIMFSKIVEHAFYMMYFALKSVNSSVIIMTSTYS